MLDVLICVVLFKLHVCFVFRFQELDLSKEAFIFSESARESDWKRFVEEALHLKQKYKMV